jgi:regulatory protein
MRSRLARAEVGPEAAEAAIRSLTEDGYLDDLRFSKRLAEDRRHLDGWGRERIARTLAGRGVPREVIEEALAGEDPGAEQAGALDLLRRRFASPPDEARDQRRALGILVRKGYDVEVAGDAIRAYRQSASS